MFFTRTNILDCHSPRRQHFADRHTSDRFRMLALRQRGNKRAGILNRADRRRTALSARPNQLTSFMRYGIPDRSATCHGEARSYGGSEVIYPVYGGGSGGAGRMFCMLTVEQPGKAITAASITRPTRVRPLATPRARPPGSVTIPCIAAPATATGRASSASTMNLWPFGRNTGGQLEDIYCRSQGTRSL